MAQTIDAATLGSSIGNSVVNISKASKAYSKLDVAIKKAVVSAKRQAEADGIAASSIVDAQIFLETALASGKYDAQTQKLLEDMKNQKVRFVKGGTVVGPEEEKLDEGFTAPDGTRYYNKESLSGSLQNQLKQLVTMAHERERNGQKDGLAGQYMEGFRSVARHAQMGSLLDGKFGSSFGDGWKSDLLQSEINAYRQGDMNALFGSAFSNYDHSSEKENNPQITQIDADKKQKMKICKNQRNLRIKKGVALRPSKQENAKASGRITAGRSTQTQQTGEG